MEEQVEEDEGFIDLLGEEATVAHLVASDDLVLSGPPVLPAAPLPCVQAPPVPSVQTPSAALLPSIQVRLAAPLLCVQTPSATPLPSAMVKFPFLDQLSFI